MATIPQLHPQLSLHLADRSLTPLISSSRSSVASSPHPQQEKQDSLASLASTALTIHDAALHFGLGRPQRAMVDYGGPSSSGPIMIQTFLDPATMRYEAKPPPATSDSRAMALTAASGGETHLTPHRPLTHRGISASSIRSALSRPTSSNAARQRVQVEGHRFRVNGLSTATHPDQRSYCDSQGFSNYDEEHDDRDRNDGDDMDSQKADEDDPVNAPPMLVGIVLSASAEEAADAGRATARLEMIGREIQRRWTAE